MNKLLRGISYFFFEVFVLLLKTLALLPLRILYILSDITAFLLYRIVRYRRSVVRDNLVRCFPEKPLGNIKSIEKAFYRNFSDYIFETLKLLHISDKQICRRMVFENVEVMDEAVSKGKDVTVYFSHTGNWEWATSLKLHSRYADDPRTVFGQIYRPLRNRQMDALMLRLRNRFGTRCIAKSTALRQFLTLRKEHKLFVVGFMSDQKPSYGDPVRIVDFFGRPTAVITGTESLARRLGTAAVYWDISKPARGHYRIHVIPMSEDAAMVPEGRLTAEYFRLLQQNISRQPELWLWTHKRWKNSPASWDEVNPETLLKYE